jgi:lysophospholipase L1-like esterase
VSDAVDLTVSDLDSLAISLFVPHDSEPCTCHPTGMQDAFVSGPGDFTAKEFEPTTTLQVRAFLSGVEVWASSASSVVVLGDSISDGVGSTPNANLRWPDLLAQRLSERKSPDRWAVVNMGISGNRVLSDGAGESALARFDRDVLAVPGASHVIVFLGINDIGLAFGQFEGEYAELMKLMPTGAKVTIETMIAAYRQLIARAHSRGLKIYGATIAPYKGAGYYSMEGEVVRQGVNDWIRQGGEFDGVLDFDAVMRDPDQPSQIANGLHSGDFLHGSDAGYRAIANSIDLSLFQ